MANISVSLNLQAYEGFKYLFEKDKAGNRTYYAAIPVKKLFNPAGTTKVYATAVMIPTPNSEYSDFMLKPMLSAKELQSMDPEQFKALPVLGTGKYLEKQIGKDVMKEAAKSATVDEEDMGEIFGMPSEQPLEPAAPQEQQQQVFDPRSFKDSPVTMFYITDNNRIIAQAATTLEALNLFKAQASPTALLTRYEATIVQGTWNKAQIQLLGI